MPQGKRVWVRKKKFNFLSRVPRSLARSPIFSERTKRKIKQRLGTGYILVDYQKMKTFRCIKALFFRRAVQ